MSVATLEPAHADDPFAEARARRGADPCVDRLLGPVALALDEGGLERSRQPCVGDGALIAVRAVSAPAAAPSDVVGALLAEARATSTAGVELTVGARLLADRVVGDDGPDVRDPEGGPIYLGVARASRHSLAGRSLAALHGLRVALPWTDTAAARVAPAIAAVPSIDVSLLVAPRLALHGRAALGLAAAFAAAGADTRAALSTSLDAAGRLGPLALALGIAGRTDLRDGALDVLAVRAAVRGAIGTAARVELAGLARLAGRAPRDPAVELALSIDL